MKNDTLKGLNEEQFVAAQHTNGPLLVLAGAGSGKTRVLTTRIAHLIDMGVKPWQILAITFTNKAAQEMRNRVERIVGDSAKDIWLYTFHSFCARFLRMEIDKMGIYDKNFVIYDTADCLNLMKTCLKELNLDDKQYAPKSMINAISNAKNQFIDSALYAQQADSFYDKKISEVYLDYQKRLMGNNALDFDDLLMLAVSLLQDNQEVRERWQNRFNYILIDEYQDTNRPQYLLAKLLSERTHNIFVVGDIDQSIYAWRGADIKNILDFEKDYPEAKTIKLECNYRSTKNILDAANAVIENNLERKPKRLWTNNPEGAAIICYRADDERDESRFVIERMKKLHNEGEKYGSMAALYRTNAQSRAFEEALVKEGIPYIMVGGLKFYERKEIKDIIAYLRVIFNPQDEVALVRIINVPKRGIGDATVAKMRAAAQANSTILYDIIKNPELSALSTRFTGKVEELGVFLEKLRQTAQTKPLEQLVEEIINSSGYVEELEAEKNVQAQSRIDNLNELLTVAKEFSGSVENSLDKFLEHVALVMDIDEARTDDDAVTLMTLHSAKGLEYDTVFLVGMEDGIFPHARTQDNECELEEERRLCYVGITRARNLLFLTHTDMRTIFGKTNINPPSRFLKELPKELLANEEKPKLHFQNKTTFVRPVRQTPNLFMPALTVKKENNVQTNIFAAGDKILHSKWGKGTIVSVVQKGNFQAVAIAFPDEGIKNLNTEFAPIEKL